MTWSGSPDGNDRVLSSVSDINTSVNRHRKFRGCYSNYRNTVLTFTFKWKKNHRLGTKKKKHSLLLLKRLIKLTFISKILKLYKASKTILKSSWEKYFKYSKLTFPSACWAIAFLLKENIFSVYLSWITMNTICYRFLARFEPPSSRF